MKSIISLLLLSILSSGVAQRITFDDPDLSFSLKKPKDWQVFDDGYVVKVSPSAKDTTSTYLSITYFEDAQPTGEMDLGFLQAGNDEEPTKTQPTKIAGVEGKYSIVEKDSLTLANYYFKKLGQRFEIVTSSTVGEEKVEQTFKKMIRSIKVNQ